MCEGSPLPAPMRLTSACHDTKFTQWESVQVLWRSGLFSLMRSQGSLRSLLKRRLAGENWSQLRKKYTPAPRGLNYLFHASRYSPHKFLLLCHVHTEHSATCFVHRFVQHIQHEPIMVATSFMTRVFSGHSNAEVAGSNTVRNVNVFIFCLYNFIQNFGLNLLSRSPIVLLTEDL
jgi:hypothetical protein